MKKIKIESPSKPHFCYFGTDLFEKLPKLISASQLPKNILVIVDSNVNKLWGKNIRETFSSLTYNVNYYILEAGEKSKSFTKVQTILKKMVELKFNRDSMIISIGGGVCGDRARPPPGWPDGRLRHRCRGPAQRGRARRARLIRGLHRGRAVHQRVPRRAGVGGPSRRNHHAKP